MTEERLKEIKDKLNTEVISCKNIEEYEMIHELYNEVVRLREIIDNAIKLCEENAEAIWEYEGEYVDMFEEIRDVLNGRKIKEIK